MKRDLYVGRVFIALIPFLTISSGAQAVTLANRVFVSARSGSDANACSSVTTPCQTFAGAVAQLNPGGEALVLDTGGYGRVTITQSVTIAAPPGVLAFIHPSTPIDAITVNAPGATVVLRGLTIDGAGQTTGNGITVTFVGDLHVESCVIAGFAGLGPSIGSGIYFTSAGQLSVKDTIIRDNRMNGIWVSPPSGGTAQASVDNCRLEQNGYGLIADNSNGIASKVAIRNGVASGNAYTALLAQTGSELNAEGCLVTYNSTGLEAVAAGSTLRASNCSVTDNTIGVFSNGGFLLSRSNNTVEGNGTNGSFTGTYSAH